MKIEQFSSLDVKGPRNILATTIQGLPGYSGSDCGEEVTRRARRGSYQGRFTRPSEKLTGLDNGLRHNFYTLEKENINAMLHMD